jgi:phosphohistidine phosphatase
MDLYLVQHGAASPKKDGSGRPLTSDGRTDVDRIAQHAALMNIKPERIWHSGKLRAAQTAEIMTRVLGPRQGMGVMEGLAPDADPSQAGTAVVAIGVSAMLVGHMPHLSRLASLMLTGDPDAEIIAFQNAGIVCLTLTDGGWRLRWSLNPKMLP